MPSRRYNRTSSSSHAHPSTSLSHSSASAATIVSAEGYLQKETDYKNGIRKLFASSTVLAEYLAISGSVESSLIEDDSNNNNNHNNDSSSNNNGINREEVQEFMQEQRQKLKALTERHVKSMRYIEACMNATKSIRTDILNDDAAKNSSANGGTDDNGDNDENINGNANDPKDYDIILQTKVEHEKHNMEQNALDMSQEQMVRDIKQCLNEKDDSRQNAARSNGANDDDDDIEIEVQQNDQESSLKCPLTGMLFVNPYRNKVCKHVYDLAAIQNHLRMKKTCPVMGCSNSHVTMDQLEVDEAMKLKVRRHKKVAERKRQRDMMSQDYDVDDEEDYGGLKEETVIQ